MTFDVVSPAAVAATHTLANIFDPERAARIVEQHAIDASLPGLGEVIDQVGAALVGAAPANTYEAEIARAVERVAAEQLMGLAASADMPQVRAIVTLKLELARQQLQNVGIQDEAARAHAQLLARDITRFLDNPEAFKRPAAIAIPPGAPIGEPGLDWLGWLGWRR
jgi:hydrogenase maturation factor HypF (carbamoyltransferase family)